STATALPSSHTSLYGGVMKRNIPSATWILLGGACAWAERETGNRSRTGRRARIIGVRSCGVRVEGASVNETDRRTERIQMSEDRAVALVTAASRGIGLACARELAAAGCAVVVLARSAEVETLGRDLGGLGVVGSVTQAEDL